MSRTPAEVDDLAQLYATGQVHHYDHNAWHDACELAAEVVRLRTAIRDLAGHHQGQFDRLHTIAVEDMNRDDRDKASARARHASKHLKFTDQLLRILNPKDTP